MSLNVVPLSEVRSVADVLRDIAAQIDSGEYDGQTATLILDTRDIFHLGVTLPAYKNVQAVFDMAYGMRRLSTPIEELPDGVR